EATRGKCFQILVRRRKGTLPHEGSCKLNKCLLVPAVNISFVSLPMDQDLLQVPWCIIGHMECPDRFAIGRGKKSVNELLRLVHQEYAATDKRKTEYRKLVPDQRSDPVQITDRAH